MIRYRTRGALPGWIFPVLAVGAFAAVGLAISVLSLLVPPFRFGLEAGQVVQDARLDAAEATLSGAVLRCDGAVPTSLDILRYNGSAACWAPTVLPPDVDVVNRLCANQTLSTGDLVVYSMADDCYLAIPPATDPVSVCAGDVPAEGQVLRYDGGAACYRTLDSIRLTDDWLCDPPAPAGSLYLWNGSCVATTPLADLATAADLAALQFDVGVLELAVDALTGNFSSAVETFVLQTAFNLSTIDDRLFALEVDVVGLRADLANLTARVDQHDLELAALGADVAALQANLTAAQADVAALFGETAALGAGLANLTARVDALEADFDAYRNATDAVLADHEARLAALEAEAPTLLAACNQTAFGDRDLARYNAGGACWEPYRINLRTGQVRINGYNSSGTLERPTVTIGAAGVQYTFAYESPLVYEPFPVTIWPGGVEPADDSIYNFENATIIENVIGQAYVWRIRFHVIRTGTATQAVYVGLINPVNGFVSSMEITSIPGGPVQADITLTTIGTEESVPPAFGGQGRGYHIFVEATSTQIDTIELLGVVRYSAPFLEP